MSFGFGLSMDIMAQSYDEAAALHRKTVPWKYHMKRLAVEYMWRPLGSNRKGTQEMRLTPDGAYEFKYHRTTVVRWVNQNTIELNVSWSSKSTRVFANAFLPYWVNVDSVNNCIVISTSESMVRSYNLDKLHLSKGSTGNWKVHNTSPWKEYRMNRKVAGKLRNESNYTAFVKHVKIANAMNLLDNDGRVYYGTNISLPRDGVMHMLAGGPREWTEFAKHWWVRSCSVPTLIKAVREQLYAANSGTDLYDVIEYDVLHSWDEVRRVTTSERKTR